MDAGISESNSARAKAAPGRSNPVGDRIAAGAALLFGLCPLPDDEVGGTRDCSSAPGAPFCSDSSIFTVWSVAGVQATTGVRSAVANPATSSVTVAATCAGANGMSVTGDCAGRSEDACTGTTGCAGATGAAGCGTTGWVGCEPGCAGL